MDSTLLFKIVKTINYNHLQRIEDFIKLFEKLD